MTAFDTDRIEVGPGTLYAAPLGTTEPTSVSGAWPPGWVLLGYTDTGSTFSRQVQTANVDIEEELFPAKIVTTGVVATLSFALAELTRQNLLVVLNAGITAPAAGTTGTGSDASIWAEAPALGSEQRIMLGWDAIEKGGDGSAITDVTSFGRLVARQCFNTGNLQIANRKGNNKRVYAGTFSLEKPAGLQPFRFWYPPQMAQ